MIEYQRVIAQINLDNIAHNMKMIRNTIDSKSKIMAIVKADAYGHGAIEVSKVALYNGADWLGVAICDEGVQIRKNNIHVPILILGYTPEHQIDEVISNNITQTIFSYEMAEAFSKEAVKLNKTADVHIKIDTGMGRIGFLPNEYSLNEILKIKELPNINITGVYTHFATADEQDKTFTYEQYDRFNYIVNKMEQSGINNIIKHVSNSGAIIDLKDIKCDMVRAGIILYGLMPSRYVRNNIDLIPAMSLKTHVSFIKDVEPKTSIGYGRTYFTKKESKIATIPVGYADGYSRLFSNKARVIVGGEFANVVGTICMDQFMVDVTGIKNIKSGDEVVLLGKQGENEVTADELAQLQGTINYEVVCNIGKRVPRVYVKDNQILKTLNYV